MRSEHTSRSRFRRMPLAAGLVLACGLMVGKANAGFPVTDVGNMFNHTMNQINTLVSQIEAATEYGQTLSRWQRTIQEYQNAMTRINSLLDGSALSSITGSAGEMQKRAENYQVAERCRSTSGGLSLGNLFSSLLPNPDGNIIEGQQKLCQMKYTLLNKKHNELIDMVQTAAQRQQEIKNNLSKLMSGSGIDGEQKAAASQSLDLMSRSLVELQYSQAKISAYDGMVQSLDSDMNFLAQKALNGNPTVLGTLTDTAMLEGALKIND